MELGYAKQIFLITKKSENVTERTVEIYQEDLDRFFNFLIKGNIFDIVEVSSRHIREFLILLQERGLNGVSRHKFYRELKTFFLFLYRENYLEKNPIADVKPPKIEQKEMRTYTAAEISKMINSFSRDTFTGFRNYCMFCLFFSTGIRKQEALDLTLADINITNDLIRIKKGKGQKERHVPIGRIMRRTLMQYLKVREEFLKDESCKWLFVTHTDNRKLTPSAINGVFHRMKKELKLTGEKISCHTWRHTFAKNYLLNGGDIFSLQKILGHSDIATTKGYLNLNEKEVKMQHARFNPLDNKDWL